MAELKGTSMASHKNSLSDEERAENQQRFAELLDAIRQDVDLDDLLHPGLDKLAEYDRANKSELLHTLCVYLDNDCNAQLCSRLLFLHRNSLVYRVHRIQEISGCDLSNPTERSYLRISFLLRR